MDFGHRRCTSWILWSLNLDKLQNFILLLGIMQAAVSRRKRRACRRHCFFTGKDGSFGRCFSCHSTMYIHGSLQNWRYIFLFFPSPVALLARFAFAFACLKNNKPPFLQACCLSYSYAECSGSLFGFMPSCWFLEIWASRHSYDCYGIFNP